MPSPKSHKGSKPSRAAQSLVTPKRAKKTAAKKPGKKAAKQAAPTVTTKDPRREVRKVFQPARQAALIEAAVVAPNESATQACIIADGAVSIQEASAMLKTPAIAGEVLKKRQSLAAEAGITSAGVMRKLWAMADSSMRDYVKVDASGSPRFDFTELSEKQWAAVQEITVEEFVERKEGTADEFERVKRTKLKLYPSREPLVDIAKHLGLRGFGNRLELVGRNGGPIELAAVASLSEAEIDRQLAMLQSGEIDSDDERTE